ncbi:hypothetical protein [Asticcacaulis sp. W401b]|uniref:hypothetical protein n=1 Tax=Asticcacaulis sp. W401b TaxID=3388666 RepID=UPI003970D878
MRAVRLESAIWRRLTFVSTLSLAFIAPLTAKAQCAPDLAVTEIRLEKTRAFIGRDLTRADFDVQIDVRNLRQGPQGQFQANPGAKLRIASPGLRSLPTPPNGFTPTVRGRVIAELKVAPTDGTPVPGLGLFHRGVRMAPDDGALRASTSDPLRVWIDYTGADTTACSSDANLNNNALQVDFVRIRDWLMNPQQPVLTISR